MLHLLVFLKRNANPRGCPDLCGWAARGILRRHGADKALAEDDGERSIGHGDRTLRHILLFTDQITTRRGRLAKAWFLWKWRGPGDAQELRVQPVDGIRGVGRHAYLAGAGEKRSGHGQCRPPAWANVGKMLARECWPRSPSGLFCRASSGARNVASSFTARSLVSFMHK